MSVLRGEGGGVVEAGLVEEDRRLAIAREARHELLEVLRALGLEMTHARKLIDAVQRHGAPDTLEAFVQAALRACS